MPARPAVLARTTQSHRARTLASDDRAGSWTRAQVRKRWADFVRARWRLLTGMALVASVLIVLATYLAPNEFLRGTVVGAGTVGTVTALMVLIVQATGTTSMSQGASAEQLTASELRPLTKHGWRLINHVSLKRWDIDHVLVGPAGVIALETKWSATDWQLDQPSERVSSAIGQVQRNAADLRRWAPVAGAGVRKVWTTVFFWNAASPGTFAPETVRHTDGTPVVRGRTAAAAWRRDLLAAEPVLDHTTVATIAAGIEKHLVTRDEWDSASDPAPPTLTRAYWTVLGSVMALTAAALISLYAFTLTRSWWLWACVTGAELLIGLYRKAALPRVLRWSWLAGAGMVVVAAGVGVAIHLVT